VNRSQLLPGNGPLSRVPPGVAFLGVAVVFGVAVWVKGAVGGVLLGVLALGVLLLLAGTWRRLRPADRVLRLLVLLMLLAVAVSVVN
jgi:energy-coupling factor transporter transmembrane protein EcfT